MTARASGAARRLRKQDLLLASELARGQAVLAFDEVAGRADAVALRLLTLRAWLASPAVWAAGSATGALVLGVALRRVRLLRLLRWGWVAHRLWRGLAPLVARVRAGDARARGGSWGSGR